LYNQEEDMIFETLNIPCEACLSLLDAKLLKVPRSSVGEWHGVFCEHRDISLMALAGGGLLMRWMLWPTITSEELDFQIITSNADMAGRIAIDRASKPGNEKR
jgi:hypothetical protein